MDGFGDDGEDVVDVGAGGGFEEAEAEAGAGAVFVEGHGHEHMAGLGGSGVAGRAAGDGDALEVEGDDEGFAFDVIEPEIGGVGDAGNGFAGYGGAVDARAGDLEQAGFEAVAEGGEALHGAVFERVLGEFNGLGEADDAGDVFRAGAAAALVAAANEEGVERGSAADVEGSDALGSVELVGADGEQMAAVAADVDGNLARALNGVDVEEGAGLMGDGADLFDGLEDAGFVVGEHDADEAGVGAESIADGLGRDESTGERGDEGDLNAALGGALGGLEDGGVLDGGGDEVVAGAQEAEDGGVVALGAAGVEDDLRLAAVEEGGEDFAGMVDGGAGTLAVEMDGGGVAEVLDPEGTHGLDDVVQERRGGVGVHVDTAHGEDGPLFRLYRETNWGAVRLAWARAAEGGTNSSMSRRL